VVGGLARSSSNLTGGSFPTDRKMMEHAGAPYFCTIADFVLNRNDDSP
jgi:hypothetical protein